MAFLNRLIVRPPAQKPTNSSAARNISSNHLRLQKADAPSFSSKQPSHQTIKSYLQLGSSSNRYAPRLPQQGTKSSTKQLAPTDPILGPENLLKTGFAQKGLPSSVRESYPPTAVGKLVVDNCNVEASTLHRKEELHNELV